MQYSQEAEAKIKSCINYLKFKEKTLADKGMPTIEVHEVLFLRSSPADEKAAYHKAKF